MSASMPASLRTGSGSDASPSATGGPVINLRKPTVIDTESPIELGHSDEDADTLSPLIRSRRPILPNRSSTPSGPQAEEIQGQVLREKKYHLGAYADVWRGTWTPPEGKPVSVAIKYLRCVKMSTQASATPETQAARIDKRLRREVYMWKGLIHPNITPLLGYRSGDEPLLISPYYENGNFIQYLKLNPGAPKLKLLVEAASGLLYLHQNNPPLVHGDIKPDNLLVNDEHAASLCDFGLARVIQDMRTGLTTSGTGQGGKGYIAPELLDGDDVEKKTTESDVFAFGGLILHTLSGLAPYYHKTLSGTIADTCMGRPPPKDKYDGISPDATIWALMHRCWALSPEERPGMQEVYQVLMEEDNHWNQFGQFRV